MIEFIRLLRLERQLKRAPLGGATFQKEAEVPLGKPMLSYY